MKHLNIFLLSIVMVSFYSCQDSTTEEEHMHEDALTLSYTIWTDKTELFVEFEPLVVGEISSFAAHFSEMEHFKAVTEGQVTVSLIKGDVGIRHTVDGPSSPGIFKPKLTPKETGIYSLVFEILTGSIHDTIVIENVEVFASMTEAEKKISTEEAPANEISFLKEQAWKMEFANAPVVQGTMYDVIKTGGRILPSQGDEKTITATASGIVLYTSNGLIIGSEVSNGQTMFQISGGDLTDNNIETKFLQAKSHYNREKANFERKSELYDAKAIAKSEYEDALLSYQLAESDYLNLAANFGNSGVSVRSSSTGFIKTLFKNEGEYVEAGEPLAVITQNKRLTIQADISQEDYNKLNNSITANFLFNGQTYSLEDFNGRLLSYGKSVSSESPKIPVFFELDNKGDLLSGSFIEVWIKTNPTHSAILIPVSALLEEYGVYSVFVQTSGESFEKREVVLGSSDGIYVQVISGVSEGERVVTTGAYQIKMASLSGQIPAHGHAH
ncbi:MAG: efflux RND transporter periplasmic adaptor subunit [Crocinitomicaceae bacterium]|nr:efflux RND transporter periplasmic adaptor subunit [Crocinitomicaceae bacterium]